MCANGLELCVYIKDNIYYDDNNFVLIKKNYYNLLSFKV